MLSTKQTKIFTAQNKEHSFTETDTRLTISSRELSAKKIRFSMYVAQTHQ